MRLNVWSRPLLIAALAAGVPLVPARAATGAISAGPNPCEIGPGAHECTAYLTWSAQGVQQARVFVRAEGKGGTQDKEFGSGLTCAKCGASWIEAGAKYFFTLEDFSTGRRGTVLATVVVTAVNGPGPRADGKSGVINAAPNPCRVQPGKGDCTAYLSWSTTGVQHARVYVIAEGSKNSPEKEFGTGRTCEKCGASWIEPGTRYLFTLYDFSTGSRGRALASVVATATK